MADLNALLDQIPVGDIAKKLGIDESVAEAAVKQVLPGLVSGLAANAKDPKGAASIEKALNKHGTKGIKGKPKVAEIDTADGEKIVKNVFGANTDKVATKLAAGASLGTKAAGPSAGAVTGDIIKQILPIVAPIVLSFLAQQFLKGKTPATETAAAPAAPATPAAPAADNGIGDLLGGLLSSPQGQQIAGDLLGGLLGGGRK
jgi:hypothetical protein